MLRAALSAAVMIIAAGAEAAEATIEDDLRACAALDYAPPRLVCYDQVALSIGVNGPVTLRDTRRSLERILANVGAMERTCGPNKAAADCKARNAEVGDRVDDAVDGIKEDVEKSVDGVAKEKLEEMIEEIDAEERLRRLNEPEKAN
jgi:hypothetical protein